MSNKKESNSLKDKMSNLSKNPTKMEKHLKRLDNRMKL